MPQNFSWFLAGFSGFSRFWRFQRVLAGVHNWRCLAAVAVPEGEGLADTVGVDVHEGLLVGEQVGDEEGASRVARTRAYICVQSQAFEESKKPERNREKMWKNCTNILSKKISITITARKI